MMTLSERSRAKLHGVHPDLVRVVEMAASAGCKFHVTEGLRSLERQKQLLAAGKSRTLKSRHLSGHAVDVVAVKNDGVSYDDADMARVAMQLRLAAATCGVPIEWGAVKKHGGDFLTFHDSPHFQLPEKVYPAELPAAALAELPTPLAMVPDKPMVRSRTMWNGLAAALASVGAFADGVLQSGLQWVATLTEMAPVKAALASAGANEKAIVLGVGIFAAVKIIAIRAEACAKGMSA